MPGAGLEGRLCGATPTSGLTSLRSPFLLTRKRPVTATVSEVGDMLGAAPGQGTEKTVVLGRLCACSSGWASSPPLPLQMAADRCRRLGAFPKDGIRWVASGEGRVGWRSLPTSCQAQQVIQSLDPPQPCLPPRNRFCG